MKEAHPPAGLSAAKVAEAIIVFLQDGYFKHSHTHIEADKERFSKGRKWRISNETRLN